MDDAAFFMIAVLTLAGTLALMLVDWLVDRLSRCRRRPTPRS